MKAGREQVSECVNRGEGGESVGNREGERGGKTSMYHRTFLGRTQSTLGEHNPSLSSNSFEEKARAVECE